MFNNARKQAQQTARQMMAGHCTLIAWWTLRHAGVLEAMVNLEAEQQSLDPLAHAKRSNMAPEVLEALLEYLADARLVTLRKEGARFTTEGRTLYENEDATLGLVKAYEPVLEMTEHLLAKLKSYSPSISATGSNNGGGVSRKTEYLLDSQSRRYVAEVFPAVANAVAKHKLSHLLDLCCGPGDLLMHVAGRYKQVVGVGIGSDGLAVRRANQAIDQAQLDKRLIAITANPFDVCLDTQRTFDRVGFSRQLWKELDGLIAMNLFSEYTGKPEEIARVLASLPRNFPDTTLLLMEPVISPGLESNYYAAEMKLLLRLSRAPLLLPAAWHDLIRSARLKLVEEIALNTDGVTIFVCRTS